jgi:hypothetical protein
MPSSEAAIIAEARRVARIQQRIVRLNRELREAKAELKLAKKNLKALASETRDPFKQSPPLRGFDEV